MKDDELKQFKKLVNLEIERRKRIAELTNSPEFMELTKLSNISPDMYYKVSNNDLISILELNIMKKLIIRLSVFFMNIYYYYGK